MSDGFAVEGKNQIRVATLLSLASAIALEMRTGLQISRAGNAIKAARIQHVLPPTGRFTRRQALEATVKAIKELWPDYEPNKFVKEALNG